MNMIDNELNEKADPQSLEAGQELMSIAVADVGPEMERETESETLAEAEADSDSDVDESSQGPEFSADGTELESFESARIEDAEFIEESRVVSIVESLLFSTDRPMSIAHMKQALKGTTATSKQIRRALDQLAVEYAGAQRGISIEEINSGFQLRTKADNMPYLRQLVKTRPFKLSGPALEVMAIAAYKQPVTKSEIDEIRGVESGHLLRGLMEKGLVHFAGKSEIPGKPMLYGTTRKFLEIFGLRNIRELPSISEIDELIPEGIGEIDETLQGNEKAKRLEDITGDLSRDAGMTYSEGEQELVKISDELESISTSSLFFEEEKNRAKAQRDRERAQDIRDALTMDEVVEPKDVKWLERYEKSLREAAEATVAGNTAHPSQGQADDTAAPVSANGHESLAESKDQSLEGEGKALSLKSLEAEVDQAFDQFFDTRLDGNESNDEEEAWESLPVKSVDV